MRRTTVAWSVGALLACVAVVGVLFIRGAGLADRTGSAAVPVRDTSSWVVNDAFVKAVSYVKAPKGRVAAGILPHHTLVAPLIAAFFRGLEGSNPPDTVVIVGPDHGNAGSAYVTTAQNAWATPDGVVQPNREFIRTLVARGVAAYDEDLIRREPGVSAIIPFLAHQFPGAKVVPLAMRGDLRADRIEKLADALAGLLGSDDLLIASVDFSHYKNVEGARTDDGQSLSAIAAGDADAALDIPVDSPPSVSLVLRFSARRGLTYQQLVSTNSAEFLHDPTVTSTTSYLTAYFYR